MSKLGKAHWPALLILSSALIVAFLLLRKSSQLPTSSTTRAVESGTDRQAVEGTEGANHEKEGDEWKENVLRKIEAVRSSLPSARSPGNYASLVGDLAYLIHDNREREELHTLILDIIAHDCEPRIRMLVCLAYGIEGGSRAKRELMARFNSGDDLDFQKLLLCGVRSGDPIDAPGPHAMTAKIWGSFVMEILLDAKCFYGDRGTLFEDFPEAAESTRFDGSTGSSRIELRYTRTYLYESRLGREVGRFLLDRLLDDRIQFNLKNHVGDLLSPRDVEPGYVQDHLSALRAFSEKPGGNPHDNELVLRFLGNALTEQPFQNQRNEGLQACIQSAELLAKREDYSQLVGPLLRVVYMGFFSQNPLASYEEATSIADQNPALAGLRNEIEETLIQNDIRNLKKESHERLLAVQREILERRSEGDPARFAFYLRSCPHSLGGFVISEARRLARKHGTNELAAERLLSVFARFGTSEDLLILQRLQAEANLDPKLIEKAVESIRRRE